MGQYRKEMKLLGFPLGGYDDNPKVQPSLNASGLFRYKEHTPLKNWSNNHTYYEVTDEDAVILKLLYPDLIEFNWTVLGPYDDQEVKIICHRCGGGLWSVSGYEWKTDERLQTYECTLDSRGKCKYD
jgi:hypothetical protein